MDRDVTYFFSFMNVIRMQLNKQKVAISSRGVWIQKNESMDNLHLWPRVLLGSMDNLHLWSRVLLGSMDNHKSMCANQLSSMSLCALFASQESGTGTRVAIGSILRLGTSYTVTIWGPCAHFSYP